MKVLEKLTVPDASAWSRWLLSNASISDGVCLTLAKKGTMKPTSLSLDMAVEEALCHGWINGQGHTIDELTYMQRFTPRAARSVWSKRNVGIVERLEKEGRMQASGRAAVQSAQADGRWQRAYSGSANLDEMQDLVNAIEANPAALFAWSSLPKGEKSQIYFRLSALKTQVGREKCIRNYVERLSAGSMGESKTSVSTAKDAGRKRSSSVLFEPETEAPDAGATKFTKTRSGRRIKMPKP